MSDDWRVFIARSIAGAFVFLAIVLVAPHQRFWRHLAATSAIVVAAQILGYVETWRWHR